MKKIIFEKLFLALLILVFALNFGQKTEFTVPKDIEALQNTIFDFTNDFTKDEPKAAAAGR
ncbi:hypothetical protein [Chryseobacterium indoltheticum]|uniref:hypothetical protein n=1 Tax=Chryseobacterium indoltheticum TaxID=254 RepID=UPI003F497303